MIPIEKNFAKRSPLNHLHFPIPSLSNPGDCGYSYTYRRLELPLSCGFSLFCNWCALISTVPDNHDASWKSSVYYLMLRSTYSSLWVWLFGIPCPPGSRQCSSKNKPGNLIWAAPSAVSSLRHHEEEQAVSRFFGILWNFIITEQDVPRISARFPLLRIWLGGNTGQLRVSCPSLPAFPSLL